MATKKAGKAVATLDNQTGTSVVNYEEQQRKDLEALSDRTAPGGGDKIRADDVHTVKKLAKDAVIVGTGEKRNMVYVVAKKKD